MLQHGYTVNLTRYITSSLQCYTSGRVSSGSLMASSIKWEKEQRNVTFFPLFPSRLYEAFPQTSVRIPRHASLPFMWAATFYIIHKTEDGISVINSWMSLCSSTKILKEQKKTKLKIT